MFVPTTGPEFSMSNTPWKPQIPLTEALARTLLHTQIPDLDLSTLTRLGAGWDHVVWRCEDLIFRFPHQHESIARRPSL